MCSLFKNIKDCSNCNFCNIGTWLKCALRRREVRKIKHTSSGIILRERQIENAVGVDKRYQH